MTAPLRSAARGATSVRSGRSPAHRVRGGGGRLEWAVWLAVAVAVAAGVAERLIDFGRAPTNSDEALAALIAREAAHGHISLFLWGQQYGGTPEAAPVLAVTQVFGTSLLAQRATTIVLGAVAALLCWRVARRLVPSGAAILAGLALWLWPVYCVDWSMHEYLYYEPTVTLGLAAILLAYRSVEGRPGAALACGVAAGLGWWINPNMATFAVPVVAVLIQGPGWAERGRRAGVALGGFAVGAAPWLVYNLRHHLASLQVGQLRSGATYPERLRNALHFAVPLLLGQRDGGGNWVWRYGSHTAAILGVAAAVTVAVVVAQWAWRGWRDRAARAAVPADMLGLAAYPFVYALSGAVGGPTAYNPRYLFFGWPFAAFLLARLVSSRHLPKAVPVGLGVLLGAAAIQQVDRLPRPGLPIGAVAPGTYDFPALVRTLERHGDTRLFTSYWNAFRIDLISGGAVVATPSVHNVARYPPYDRAVRAAPSPAWVFFVGSVKLHTFEQWMAATHIASRSYDVGGFVVVDPEVKVLPEQVPVPALINPAEGQ